jgi:hypothetical protein
MEACAAPRRVCSTAACAALERVSLDQAVLSLNERVCVSIRQESVLCLGVSSLQQRLNRNSCITDMSKAKL